MTEVMRWKRPVNMIRKRVCMPLVAVVPFMWTQVVLLSNVNSIRVYITYSSITKGCSCLSSYALLHTTTYFNDYLHYIRKKIGVLLERF